MSNLKITALISCVALLALTLSGCGSLETKSNTLKIGNTKSQVQRQMGPPDYSKAEKNLEIWQYATIAGFGYCDYRRVWFWKGKVTNISAYHHASIAGCSAGLKRINWETAMEEAPITSASSTEAAVQSTAAESISPDAQQMQDDEPSSLADELAKLEALHSSGVLTDAEFEQAKHKLLAGK